MKVIILKSNLKTGLDVVGRSMGSNANLPILSSVLIKASGNQITLSSTNLELAITKTVFGKVIEEGGVAIPYSILSSIVNNSATERVNLEVKKNNLVVKTDNYEANIQGMDEKEFPIIPSVSNKKEYVEIEGATLKEALSKTTLAAEASDLRPEISGVLFSIESSSVKIAATDSFRLAEATIASSQAKSTFEKGLKITVPLRAAQELARVVEDDEKIRIYTDETQILFESESLKLISRVIDGKFPDYESIVPKDIENNLLLDREELMSGLKLAGSFSGRNNEITLRVKDKKTVELYSSDNHLGENKYIMPTKGAETDMEVVFNWQYLLDGIKNEKTKDVLLGLNGEEKPTLIKSPNSATYFYILMPIRP